MTGGALALHMVSAASVARMIRENVAMRQTFQVVEDALETNPCLDGPCMELLLRAALPHFYAESGKFPLSFPEARALDDYFFHVGNTHFWRRAYGFPVGGALPQQPHVHAADVGMFTFNLKP